MNSFKKKLLLIKEDLSGRHRDKDMLLKFYIAKRLSESLNCYYKELSESVNYLTTKDAESVIKKF